MFRKNNSDSYDLVAQELKRGEVDEGLMLESTASAEGNQAMARAYYVKRRAKELAKIVTDKKPKVDIWLYVGIAYAIAILINTYFNG